MNGRHFRGTLTVAEVVGAVVAAAAESERQQHPVPADTPELEDPPK